MAQTFTKDERLCSLKEINALVKDGHVLFQYPFRVSYMLKETQPSADEENNSSCNKLLISVPKKNFKRAVHRNLLKRRIRESYRKNKGLITLPASKSANIMLVYVSKDILEYKYIETKVKEILGKISKAVSQDC